MTEHLADKKCVPCRGGVPPLKGPEVEKLHNMVPRWTVVKDHHIQREYKFPDFKQALEFVGVFSRIAGFAIDKAIERSTRLFFEDLKRACEQTPQA